MTPALHSWSFRERFRSTPSFDIFQALEETAQMGFRAIEIMAGKAGGPPDHAGPAEAGSLQRVVRHATSLGVRVVCWSTYNDFAYVRDESWRRANVDYIRSWCRLAAESGVPNLRLLTGYFVPGEDPRRLEQLVEDGIRECAEAAESAGINLALENHSSVFLTASSILDLIGRVGSPRLTTCPDPTNWEPRFFEPDCPAEAREEVYRQTALLAPRATQAHCKIRGLDPAGRLLGYDLDRLLRIYHDAGYDGCLAFESIAPGDLLAPLAAARRAVEESLARLPAGPRPGPA